MKIKLAFYKKSKSMFGALIRFQQKTLQGIDEEYSQYSHAEIVFCDMKPSLLKRIKNMQYDSGLIKKPVYIGFDDHVFFSSSESDGGCRFKRILPKKEHWDFIDIEVSQKKYLAMFREALRLEGRKYGWAGIFFAQGFGYNIHESWIARVKLFLSKHFKFIRPYFGHFCSETSKKICHQGFGSDFSKIVYKPFDVFANPAQWNLQIRDFKKFL